MKKMRLLFCRIFIGLLILVSACSEKNGVNHEKQKISYEPAIVEIYQEQVIGYADSILFLQDLSLSNGQRYRVGYQPGTYISLACYWWPNPESDNGLPYIRIDGLVNPETRSEASDLPLLINMAQRVAYLSAAYNITGREDYAKKAVEQLSIWFNDNDNGMLPHLEHAQMIKGLNTGRSYGIIDGWWLVRVLESVALLIPSPHWSYELETGLKSWFSDFLFWLLDSNYGRIEMNSENNHGTWYDVQVITYATFIGRTEIAREHLEGISKHRLIRQFSPSGRQKFEMRRNRPLHYGIYNLAGQLKLAEYASLLGVEYGYRGTMFSSSLERGVLYLIRAIDGSDTTVFSDPHDRTDIDILYLDLLESAVRLYQNDEIINEKNRYISEQEFINPPAIYH
jgi:hypothetical protein